jgi:Mn2+/Fe2+ NRAMP family transporter
MAIFLWVLIVAKGLLISLSKPLTKRSLLINGNNMNENTVTLASAPVKKLTTTRFSVAMLGPGLLFAATSVGTSHLVQSTRAGALYGLALVGIILLANAVKYPFFRFANDYYPATGVSLLDAYRQQGKGFLLLFLFITLTTLLFATSALALMCAGLIKILLSLSLSTHLLALAVIIATGLLLIIGHYKILERVTKILIVVMVFCTLVATVAIMPDVVNQLEQGATVLPTHLNMAGALFVAALIGWMPVPLDASVWQSLWTKAKAESSAQKPSMRDSRIDFNSGFIGTVILAICFLLMGSALMFNKGIILESGSVAFSTQLIGLYQAVFGSVFGPVIGVAALAIIYSSLLALMDAFPRTLVSLHRRWKGIPERDDTQFKLETTHPLYLAVLAFMLLCAAFSYWVLPSSLTALIDLAATIAFVTAPLIAWLNYQAITDATVPVEHQPGVGFRIYSLLCLSTMAVFALGYLYLRFFTE